MLCNLRKNVGKPSKILRICATLLYRPLAQLNCHKKLGCSWYASRTLAHVVFPTLRPANCNLLAGFSDSQSFTRGQLLTAYWPYFPTFTYRFPILRHQWRGYPRAIELIFGMRILECLGYSVVWSQYINVTDTHTTSTYRKWIFTCTRRSSSSIWSVRRSTFNCRMFISITTS